MSNTFPFGMAIPYSCSNALYNLFGFLLITASVTKCNRNCFIFPNKVLGGVNPTPEGYRSSEVAATGTTLVAIK